MSGAPVDVALPPWARPERQGSNYIDLLRLLLASLVIVGHSYDLTTGRMHSDPLGSLTHGATSLASLAVDGFFTLSGFLISASFLRSRSFWDFLRKRVRRIYPGFLVANALAPLAAVALGLAGGGAIRLGWELVRYAGYSALLGEYSPPQPFPGNVNHLFNGSLWTIRYEFLCYLLCAAVLAAVVRRRWWVPVVLLGGTTAAAVGLEALAARWVGSGAGAALGLARSLLPSLAEERWLRFLLDFGAGSALYLGRAKVPRRTDLALGSVVAWLVVGTQAPLALRFVTPVALGYVLLWLAFARPTPATRWAERVGDWSYGVYLYAYPVQQAFIARAGAGATPTDALVGPLIVTLVLGACSWHVVEKRFLRRGGRVADEGRAGATP